jgi:hypothetical protein
MRNVKTPPHRSRLGRMNKCAIGLVMLAPTVFASACTKGADALASPVVPQGAGATPVVAKFRITGIANYAPLHTSDEFCPIGFLGATSMSFDASDSTGSNLTYRIDFGDGSPLASTVRSVHTFKTWPTARPNLIVASRDGGVSSISKSVCLIAVSGTGIAWSHHDGDISRYFLPVPDADDPAQFSGWYHSDKFPDYTGVDSHWLRFAGHMNPDRSLELTLENHVTLRGTATIAPKDYCCFAADVYFDLTVRGGEDDGRTFRYVWQDSY